MIQAIEALERLRDGNRRFASGFRGLSTHIAVRRRRELVSNQEPFAAIVGCSDSRVPVEMVFNQGLGDLFVIRVAGNIAAPSQIGSVEFAVEHLGTRLVVVLGHTGCGAVQATLEDLDRPADTRSPHLQSIVDRIMPSIETLLAVEPPISKEDLLRRAVRANVHSSVEHLRHASPVLERLIERDGLVVVGAEYSLETGLVDFFDGPLASEAASGRQGGRR